MNLGIGLGVTNYLRVPTVALDPDAAIAELFRTGTPGVYYEGAWYDPSDSSTVWQDAAGTTPAGVGDPVGRIDDKSGNGNHATQTTSAARPVLQQSGDLYYLDFDGVDDWMAGPTFIPALAQPNTIGIGIKQDVLYSLSTEYGFFFDGLVSTERHALFATNGLINFLAGTVQSIQAQDTGNHILSLHYNTTSSEARVDGVSVVSSVDVGSQSWGALNLGTLFLSANTPPQSDRNINGRIYSFVGVNRTLTAAEITDLETYLAAKSGVTI